MKILNLLILLSLCMYLLASSTKSKKLKYSIIGAGPVGIYLSYMLLRLPEIEKVTLYERKGVKEGGNIDDKTFTRPQCLRLPFEIANGFDDEIKKELWPTESIRKTIFKDRKSDDSDFKEFWPLFGYQHFPRIKVGNFQFEMMKYLKSKYSKKNKFEIIGLEVNKEKYKEIVKDSDLVIISAGNTPLSKEIRQMDILEDLIAKSNTNELDGVYLIYNNKYDDDYIRNGKYMNRFDLSKKGITYSATNNKEKSVQLYTYDVAGFKDMYQDLKNSGIKEYSKWPEFINYSNFKSSVAEIKNGKERPMYNWMDKFKKTLNDILKEFKIELPKEENVHVHWAPRMYYAYKYTHKTADENPKTVFVGDAMGGTDYKYGLNLGRGLYSAKQLVAYLSEKNFENKQALTLFQKYWDDVLAKEFESPTKNLSDVDHIKYKYIVRGRKVDGTLYDEKNYNTFLSNIKNIKNKRIQNRLR